MMPIPLSLRRRVGWERLFALVLMLATAASMMGGAARAQEKIIGGDPAKPGAFPYVGAIWVSGIGASPWCDGALIAPTMLLTSASCTYWIDGSGATPFVPEDLTVSFAGEDGLLFGQQQVQVTWITRNPRFDMSTCYYPNSMLIIACHDDAAILELAAAPAGVKPVSLVTSKNGSLTDEGRKLAVAGWSGEFVNMPPTGAFTQATLPVLSPALCERRFDQITTNYHANPPVEFDSGGNFCLYRTAVGPCYEELGGPTLAKQHGAWLLAGVANTTMGCAQGKWPVVYTRLSESKMNSWVRATAGLPSGKSGKGGR